MEQFGVNLTHGGVMMTKVKKRRMNIYLSQDMYEFVEEQAEKMGLSLSAVAILAIYQFRQQNYVLPQLKAMTEILNEHEQNSI